jgi:hypothetical protein
MLFRNERNDNDNNETSQDRRARMYDASFSETQTESQVRFYHVQLLLLLSYVFHGKMNYSASAQVLTNENLQYTG